MSKKAEAIFALLAVLIIIVPINQLIVGSLMSSNGSAYNISMNASDAGFNVGFEIGLWRLLGLIMALIALTMIARVIANRPIGGGNGEST